MTQLLVSVRNAAEAEAALRGGAHLIDVKEPANGPLGRADYSVVAEVLAVVKQRVPVSAAMGELLHEGTAAPTPPRGLAFLKWGLQDGGKHDWQEALHFMIRLMERMHPCTTVVSVAYADWWLADAPPVDEVCAFARQRPGSVFLLDTWAKDRSKWKYWNESITLLDHVRLRHVALLCRLCRNAGVRVALAGSLQPAQIEPLLAAAPDWIAVRGAACVGGRQGTVTEAKVRGLVDLVQRG